MSTEYVGVKKLTSKSTLSIFAFMFKIFILIFKKTFVVLSVFWNIFMLFWKDKDIVEKRKEIQQFANDTANEFDKKNPKQKAKAIGVFVSLAGLLSLSVLFLLAVVANIFK